MILFIRKIYVFLKRDILESLSYQGALLFNLLGILTHLATFFFITKMIGAGAGAYLKDCSGQYFPFVLTGIAFSGFSAVALTSFSSAVRTEQDAGTLEAILVTPTSPWILVLSSFFWALLASLAQTAVYLMAGKYIFHVDFSRMNVITLIVLLFLTVLSLSGPGLLSAAFALVFKRGDPVSFFFNAGSRFLAGVYFPISILPFAIQKLSWCLPLTYSLKAMRSAVMEGESLLNLRHEITALLLFALIFLPVGIFFFQKALYQAKKDGSLSFV